MVGRNSNRILFLSTHPLSYLSFTADHLICLFCIFVFTEAPLRFFPTKLSSSLHSTYSPHSTNSWRVSLGAVFSATNIGAYLIFHSLYGKPFFSLSRNISSLCPLFILVKILPFIYIYIYARAAPLRKRGHAYLVANILLATFVSAMAELIKRGVLE